MPRLDALATQFLIHPLRRLLPPSSPRVPILMYHSVSDTLEQVHPYYRTVTAPAVFEEQMKFLAASGYTTVRPNEVVDHIQGERVLRCPRPIVITFDDGFLDFYVHAFPILEKYGLQATMYLPTAYIGREGKQFQHVECMTWSQVRELHKAGVEFGSHTVNHPQLRTLPADRVREELVCSKAEIEDELGGPIGSFAYPYAFPEADGAFCKMFRDTLEAAGYQNGVSTIIGTANTAANPFFMPRLPVNSCDDIQLLEAKLEGSYDWLGNVQYASKVLIRRS
jgi:peptidoglycan/xylan/chitin deacetylase (PgdA/CDA1 family)